MILLLGSDWAAGGGTALVRGSHRWVHTALRRAGEVGLSHQELNGWATREVAAGREAGVLRLPYECEGVGEGRGGGGDVENGGSSSAAEHQIVGECGDAVLMHPWLVHSGTTNLSNLPRILLNGHGTGDERRPLLAAAAPRCGSSAERRRRPRRRPRPWPSQDGQREEGSRLCGAIDSRRRRGRRGGRRGKAEAEAEEETEEAMVVMVAVRAPGSRTRERVTARKGKEEEEEEEEEGGWTLYLEPPPKRQHVATAEALAAEVAELGAAALGVARRDDRHRPKRRPRPPRLPCLLCRASA